jgi:hypothetical protein
VSYARRSIGTVLLIAVVIVFVGVVGMRRAPATSPRQPLPMSHKRHIAKDMKCRACHQGVEGEAMASFPTLADCMDCHKTQQGQVPSEPQVRAFAAHGQELTWVRLNHLPGHVYFSHAAHVTLGRVRCEACHRDMSKVDQALGEADVHLDMSACVACHRDGDASLDCLACHK